MKKVSIQKPLQQCIKSRKKLIQNNILKWGYQNYRNFPWRNNKSPYTILVAEILLKRTTASAVSKIYQEFISRYPSIHELKNAKKYELQTLLKRIGYHKRRTEIFLQVAEHIFTKYSGKIPSSREKLLEIPNIGNYTANAILSLGYGIPAAMVDSNVIRIIKRLFANNLPQKFSLSIIQKIANEMAPKKNNESYNLALLDFGALVCRYGKPRCKDCPLIQTCDFGFK